MNEISWMAKSPMKEMKLKYFKIGFMYVKNKEHKLPFSKNYFWNTTRNSAECQTVWIQIRTDVLSVLLIF